MIDSRKLICLGGLLLLGCDPSNSQQSDSIPMPKASPIGTTSNTESSSLPAGEATERRIGGVKFKIPADWEEKALSNTMIHGEYSLPGEAGAARLTLSTTGGGTEANMVRWKGQFRRSPSDPEPVESRITVAGKEVTLLELYGTHTEMFGGGAPKSNWQLLGAAIPIDSDKNYFVKLTGPRETVTARHDEFLNVIKSARFD